MKKLSFLLAFVLLFSFCLGACGQPQPNPKLDDLNKLCDTLEKNHYNLYANVSEEEFQAEREKIARQTVKMTDEEFYWSVCHLVSLIGDAHTMVGNTGEPFMTALLWSIKKFDEGWYILKLDQKNEQYLGTRVIAINGVPIDEAVERARQVISYETDSWFWNLVPQTLAWRGALEYLEIVKEGEPVTVTVEMQDGRMSLNARPVTLRVREVPAAITENEIAALREQGFNTLKLLPGPVPESLLNFCDVQGLYVIAQAPIDTRRSGESRRKGGNPSNDPEWQPAYLERTENSYHTTKRHPSVVAFALATQSANGINLYESYLNMKRFGDSRPFIYPDAGGEWDSDKLALE